MILTPEAERAADPPEPSAEPTHQTAERVFCDEWAKVKGRAYSLSPDTGPRGDVSVLSQAFRKAREECPSDPVEHFRRKVRGYLRDVGMRNVLVDKAHPARLLMTDWNAYGNAPAKRPVATQRAPEPPVEGMVDEDYAAAAAAAVAAMTANIGRVDRAS